MPAILFARRDSIYKTLDLDVYDIDRDARSFPGGDTVIAHPPCRAWGRLRHFAKPRLDEKELAIFAVKMVRKWGGVLEHPASSTLWQELNLPLGNRTDEFGGYTIDIDQFWFGHKAKKKTWLYIVGVNRQDLPPIPLKFDAITHVVNTSKRDSNLKEITKKEREATPILLANWLVDVAKLAST